MSEDGPSIAEVRKLLQSAFTAGTLRRFLLDRPRFRAVGTNLSSHADLNSIIDDVIDYCRIYLLWDEFLAEVKVARQRHYARFERKLWSEPEESTGNTHKEESMAGTDLQRRILETVVDLREGSNEFVRDERIAEELGIEKQRVHDYLKTLENMGLVQLAESKAGASAMDTSQGRVWLEAPTVVNVSRKSGDTFIFGGDIVNTNLNIKNRMKDVNQLIQTAPAMQDSMKTELESLTGQLGEELAKVPPEHVEQVDAVTVSTEALVELATAEKPNKTLVEISSEGLKKAAATLAEVMPTVLVIATQIVNTIGQFM